MQWAGVMPAITTCFKEDLTVDHAFVARHANWLIGQRLHRHCRTRLTRRRRHVGLR